MTDWRNDSYWLALKEDAPRLLNQIRQLGAAEEEAKDLLQETLIRVLQARDRYDGRVPVGAFAFGFAVRVVA
ncbi:MAG: sigma-70 family RNA polymerase sigma factor, partial [Myxococcales bacterium]|nr:sigma-70 family RNA polymerase sigma factor [Myxococcales bacterium]